ncbi:MAG: helix-turn-helix transcriptional regulator [Bacteroidia bacterium]|nr:helix-turn-helix transcriptional regulator [Bacteroidia bacterium]
MSKEDPQKRIDLLEEHIRDFTQKTTVDSVSDHSFYSYRHANRLFKELKGESIKSFANKIRIQASAELLKYTSWSIFDIALEVGYESTAAFSKAFKKLFNQAPSEFRQSKSPNQIHLEHEEVFYLIQDIQGLELQLFKERIGVDADLDKLYQITKDLINGLDSDMDTWLLLWDEDPELSQVVESPYFVGIPNSKQLAPNKHGKEKTIKGRYAIFETASFEDASYSSWHEIAFLMIDLDGIKLRDAYYLEWFTASALQSSEHFFPYKIAIPIQ